MSILKHTNYRSIRAILYYFRRKTEENTKANNIFLLIQVNQGDHEYNPTFFKNFAFINSFVSKVISVE